MVYFIADLHLGSPIHTDSIALERAFVAWTEAIAPSASAVYLLGDIFDFWYEYRYVVPKGYIRFLGALAKLADSGVKLHYLIGNHDVWCRDYFQNELGATLYKQATEVYLDGKLFRLAHGDEEYRSHSFAEDFLYRLFRNPLARTLLSAIHPRWVIPLGMSSSKQSRIKGIERGYSDHKKNIKEEWLYLKTLELTEKRPDIDFFLFGHRHLLADTCLPNQKRLVLLGDWLKYNSYAQWDGQRLALFSDVSIANPLGNPYKS